MTIKKLTLFFVILISVAIMVLFFNQRSLYEKQKEELSGIQIELQVLSDSLNYYREAYLRAKQLSESRTVEMLNLKQKLVRRERQKGN